jgi:hypothetical protein
MASHCCDWQSEPGLAHRVFTDNDHEAPGINRIQRGGERAKAVARQGVAQRDRKHPDLLRGNSLFECGGTTGDTGGLFWPLKGIQRRPEHSLITSPATGWRPQDLSVMFLQIAWVRGGSVRARRRRGGRAGRAARPLDGTAVRRTRGHGMPARWMWRLLGRSACRRR